MKSIARWLNGTPFMSPTVLIGSLGIAHQMQIALHQAADVLVYEWKEVLSTPGRGKEYAFKFYTDKSGRVRPMPGALRWKVHRASAPGDPPAPDTGTLRRSIRKVELRPDLIRVGTNLRYGLALEYGVNVTGSKVGPHPDKTHRIEPRPHARPALDRARGDMKDSVKTTLRFPGKGKSGV